MNYLDIKSTEYFGSSLQTKDSHIAHQTADRDLGHKYSLHSIDNNVQQYHR